MLEKNHVVNDFRFKSASHIHVIRECKNDNLKSFIYSCSLKKEL